MSAEETTKGSDEREADLHDDEEDDGRHRKKQKVAVMGESGQTDAERRRLRAAQRKLHQDISGAGSSLGDSMEDAKKEAFRHVRQSNNHLWDNVRYSREAVLDGENLDLISARAARQVDRLVQVPRYDTARLTQKLRSKCSTTGSGSSSFNWILLGVEAGSCFNAVPSRVSFLAGPAQAEYTPKQRTKPRKRTANNRLDDVEAEKPESVKQKDEGGSSSDRLSAVERNIAVVCSTLHGKCQERRKMRLEHFDKEVAPTLPSEEDLRAARRRVKNHGGEICAVQYLMNPRSFTQTVENIFHFSFLVKKGDAGVGLRSRDDLAKNRITDASPGPFVTRTSAAVEGHKRPPNRQAVVAFTMRDWKELCKAYDVLEGDIPHRSASQVEEKSG